MANELIKNMTDEEVRKFNKETGRELEKRGAGIGAAVDWGSISDSELATKKHELFRQTKAAARRKAVEAEHKSIGDAS